MLPLTEPLRGSVTAMCGRYTAPGWRLSRPTGLRASSGSSRICFWLMTLPRLASVVLMGETIEVTSTVSVCAPISIGTSILVRTSTGSATFSRTAVLKPVSSTLMLYSPGGSARN